MIKETIYHQQGQTSVVRPQDWIAEQKLTDLLVKMAFKVAYEAHRLACFFLRPKVHGAYVAVWHQQKILLIRNSYKTAFTLPCGGIKKNETSEEAAKRELQEEVGLDLPLRDFNKAYETVSRCEFKEDHIVFYEVYLTQSMSIELDGREVVWAGLRDAQQALDMPLFPPVKEYLLAR